MLALTAQKIVIGTQYILKSTMFLLYKDKVDSLELIYKWLGVLMMSSWCLP